MTRVTQAAGGFERLVKPFLQKSRLSIPPPATREQERQQQGGGGGTNQPACQRASQLPTCPTPSSNEALSDTLS